ncbi:MAG: hypothetical protein ABIG63_07455 [Chloroflexota bacterium]
MSKINPILTRRLAWLLCSGLALAGLIIGIRAITNFNKAAITIEWATESELDTVGFNLLRGETEDGPFEQINAQIIPSSPDPLTGGEYSFNDPDVESGQTYYYMLEEIEASGGTNQHGPIIQVATNTSKVNLLLAVVLLGSAGFYTWLLLTTHEQHNEEA